MKYKNFIKKRVFLVGGSEGIGLETAKQLAGLQADVFIFARTQTKLEKAIKKIESCRIDPEQKFAYKSMDITDHLLVEKVMTAAVDEFGVPDLLINNAGRAYPEYAENISYEQFDDTMKVNLYGIRNVVSVLLPHMRKNGGGHIVNVSSMVGFLGVFGYTDYAASKFAVVGYSETLRTEVKWDNIAVSVVCPPDTDTPGFQVENQTKPIETQELSASAKVRSPEYVAAWIINGIAKKRQTIVPGYDSAMIYYLKRFMPWLVDWGTDSAIKKGRKKRGL